MASLLCFRFAQGLAWTAVNGFGDWEEHDEVHLVLPRPKNSDFSVQPCRSDLPPSTPSPPHNNTTSAHKSASQGTLFFTIDEFSMQLWICTVKRHDEKALRPMMSIQPPFRT